MKAKGQINISLAAFPAMRHERAVQTATELAHAGCLFEPALGHISTEHIQLVPQNFGLLDAHLCDVLMQRYPQVNFRLHANVRVLGRAVCADISGLQQHHAWFVQAATISKRLQARAYTAHSGLRVQATMVQMLDNARRLAELFECPVGVEGQYPGRENPFLVSSWQEYRQLFDSGVPYALDLSHLNILAHATGVYERTLTREMLASEQCLEVHVSDNNGVGDWHQVCERTTWWHELLAFTHPKAVIFTEGNHRYRRKV